MGKHGNWVCGTFLAGALALSACGGGSESSEAAVIATAADNLFPLDRNGRWIYSSGGAPRPTVSTVTGTRAVAGGLGTVVSTADPALPADEESIYVVDDGGVREYAPAGADAIGRALDGMRILRWPAKAGETIVELDKTIDAEQDFDGDGRSDRLALFVESTAVASETVETPAGRFPGSLHQRQAARQTFIFSSGAPSVTIQTSIDSWFAPGVGLVKSVVSSRGLGPEQTTTETLLAYRVGARTSDEVAPTVSATTPGAAPVRGAGAAVSAVFSEAMDAASFGPDGFTVVDGAGQRVAGTVEVVGTLARFVPARALGSGPYAARLDAGVRDLVGNSLAAAHTWNFVVDATAPGIVGTLPAPQADDVALDTSIVLRFSEAPAPASVSSLSVRLRDGSGAVPALLTVQGDEVRIQPTAPLQRSTNYQVEVGGVTDVVGNPMAQGFEMRFRTVQGRFAYPVQLLPGLVVEAMVVADVDGDGRNDVLAATGFSSPSTSRLWVRLGQADGSLAAAVPIDVGPALACPFNSVAVGDLNGDGRADIAVGGSFCGVQVLHGTAAGGWTLGPFLAHPASSRLRIADVDGDGRLDLVGVGGGVSKVVIWRQTPGGDLTLLGEPATGSSFGRDIEVGDVNGDGRADLVVVVGMEPGRHVAVLLQRADGTFAPPSFLDTGSPWGATGLALGDFNGDGRIDIAATTGGNSPTHLALFFQSASGVPGPVTKVPTYDIPTAVRAADIDGDGRVDLVVSHVGWMAVGLYLQQANGVLAPELRFAAPYGSDNPHSMALGDIDRDERIDIVLSGEWIRQLPVTAPAALLAPLGKTRVQRAGALLRRALPVVAPGSARWP